MKPQFSAILLLLVLYFPIEAQTPYPVRPFNPDEFNCAVRGRVLDDANKPVARAMTVLDSDHQIFFFESDSEGKFFLDTKCWNPVAERILFVTSPFDLSGIVPIEPPDYCFSRLGAAHSGQPIVLKENEVLEVGDVHVQVYYSNVIIKFLNQADAPLFRKNIDWGLVWLRVRNERGRVVHEGGMSNYSINKYVRPSESSISIYLPEGKWFFEISPHEHEGPWYKTAVPVEVYRSNSPIELTLNMSLPKN